MASTAAAGAVAAKAAAGAVMPSAVSGPQPLAFCRSRLVQFPRLADRSRHMLRAVRRLHSSSCAAQTSPQIEPQIHEAIMQEHSDQYAEGVVNQEFQRGFKLGAKLLRPAMVKVSSGPGASSPPVSEASATHDTEAESNSDQVI